MADSANRVELTGVITEMDALRHTPAGIPVLAFRLQHESERLEAGSRRRVSAEIEALAFETEARLLAASALGRGLRAEGFLCAKSRRSKKPVLHVTRIEFTEEV